jgi:adenylosuccinate lyase
MSARSPEATPDIPAELHERWLSPLSFRYGSPAMRRLWSEAHKRRTWRRVWVALAAAQAKLGLVNETELEDLRRHQDHIDVAAAERIEREIKHDLVAELRVFASQATVGGRILHLGATSMDIEDNADVVRTRDALVLIESSLDTLLGLLRDRIRDLADHATMGFTHLQPAEPTTLGYRLAQYAQDLLDDAKNLARVRKELRAKGMKGAAGTSAGYVELLGSVERAHAMESLVLETLDLRAFPVATQTYPRKQDLTVVDALASLGQSLYRLAYDVRLLQSPVIGEVMEPFGKHQVGSSAMPFKQNPVAAENVDSLARQLAALPRIAWDNAAHSHLERTLDDSANRRSLLPEAFLLADTILSRSRDIVMGLTIEPHASRRLLDTYGVFAATEKLLMEATRLGGNRQELHEVIREHAMVAWPLVRQGQDNPLAELLATDPRITAQVSADRVRQLLDASTHVGDAPVRARRLADELDEHLRTP